ncbi:uncharacterized protein BX663DRAFT_499282, partial [Cokeromyces recurvatus]|uniref:uncharacterized protein n=1 Tax=Cokeromyces recurvatus TaxID=90255 RepID=UPI00221F175C
RRLTGVSRDNHNGGGGLSFEDGGAIIVIPYRLSYVKHIFAGHYISIPKDIASFTLQYLMDHARVLQAFVLFLIVDIFC